MTARARRSAVAVAAAGAAVLVSCTSIGPGTIPKDRTEYAVTVGVSWEQQVLLNLVRVRYAESPTFVEVTGIVGGYEFSRNVSAETSLGGSPFEDGVTLEGGATLIDRPTVTYAPLAGEAFVTKVLAPIPLGSLLTLVQTGYPAEPIFNTFLRAFNGVQNHLPRSMAPLPGEPEFPKLTAALQRLQDAGAIDFRVRKDDDEKVGTFLIIKGARDSQVNADLEEVRRLLAVPPGQSEIKLVFGILPGGSGEVTAASLSMYQVLLSLAWDVEVPEEDQRRGAALPAPTTRDGWRRLAIRVKTGTSKPDDSFVAVQHRGAWFWVESTDLQSKLSLSAICLMLRALETGPGLSPVLTIPAG